MTSQTLTTQPQLIVFSGRPGTGKTTVAQALIRTFGGCYLRIDAIETALTEVGVSEPMAGYAVLHQLAVSNLVLGQRVVIDAVNPVHEARAAWVATSERAGSRLICFETYLQDAEEHKRRVEQRKPDIPGHQVPSWSDVAAGPWDEWDPSRDGERTLVEATDTACALDQVLAVLRRD